MVEIIEILRQEHRNIEKLLLVMEQELTVFDRGERPAESGDTQLAPAT
jgi:hemerythrin-like domain-containing protein